MKIGNPIITVYASVFVVNVRYTEQNCGILVNFESPFQIQVLKEFQLSRSGCGLLWTKKQFHSLNLLNGLSTETQATKKVCYSQVTSHWLVWKTLFNVNVYNWKSSQRTGQKENFKNVIVREVTDKILDSTGF